MATQPFWDKASVQTAIVSGIFLIIITWMGNNSRELADKVREKDNKIRELEVQLIPFKTVALERYTGNESERLHKLADDIKGIQVEAESQKWKRAAKFSQYCSFTGAVFFTDDPVMTLMGSSIKPLGSGKYNVQCGDAVITNLEKVIQMEPTCPYPYFHLAYCYVETKDSRSKENALKAKEIFEKTTSVEGHNLIHDKGLKNVIELLSKIE